MGKFVFIPMIQFSFLVLMCLISVKKNIMKLVYKCTFAFLYILYFSHPSSNFEYFKNNLELMFHSIYSNSIDLIICGDFTTDYLNNSSQKQLLNSLLATYCLHSMIQFSTRIHNNSASAIGNIFINIFKYKSFTVYQWINGMTDHDAQIIVLQNITTLKADNHFYFMRKFITSSVLEFNIQLTYESCDNVFA